MIRTVLCALILWLVCLPGHAASTKPRCTQTNVFSGFESDLFYRDSTSLVTDLKGTPLNTIATTIAWSVVQQRDGDVDISPYTAQLDALVKSGYCLILLIDTSGRNLSSEIAVRYVKDLSTIPRTSTPDWIDSAIPNAFAKDFFEGASASLEFNNSQVKAAVNSLYNKLIPALTKRYGKSIVAFSPCVTSECEIKYTQNGFKWESYTRHAKDAFRNYLHAVVSQRFSEERELSRLEIRI